MARLHTIGYEMNDTNYETGVTYAGTPAIAASPVRTGTYSLAMTYQDTIGYNVSGATAVYVGFGMYNNSVTSAFAFLDFYSSSGLLARLQSGIGGAIQAYRGTASLLQTSSNVMSPGGWYYLEVYYLPDESAGVITVRVNGVEWLTVTADTKGNAEPFTAVRFTCPAAGMSYNVDDLVINDTSGSVNNSWPGQQRLYLATCNAAGDATELTPSTGANYTCIDEIPPSTTDYVYGATATNRDLYNISDPLAGTETLGSVVINIVAKLDSGSGNLATTLKANVTESDGANIGLTENWTFYQQTWNQNPDDSAAWAPTDIDTLQIGVEIKA